MTVRFSSFLPLALLAVVVLVCAPSVHSALPRGTAFVTRTTSLPNPILELRGGSDSLYNDSGIGEDFEEEDSKKQRSFLDLDEDEDEEIYEEADETLLRESSTLDDEEEFVDALQDEEDFVQIEQEEIFESDDEEEEAFEEESEVEPAAASKEEVVTTQVLEKATSMVQTDDENSSAFVDRMDLADAYDVEDVVENVEDTELATVSAAKAVEKTADDGGSDDEDAPYASSATASGEEAMVMTEEMRDVLVNQLRFKTADVDVMRPDIAAIVVANKLRKPIEGMPPNWYLPGASPKAISLRKTLVKATVTVAVVGALVLVGSKEEDSDFLEGVSDALKKIPATLAAFSATLTGRSTSKPISAVPEEAVVEAEEEAEDMDDHPHSVKPGASEPPAYESDLDKSALDKIWTKIENLVTGFFRIKI